MLEVHPLAPLTLAREGPGDGLGQQVPVSASLGVDAETLVLRQRVASSIQAAFAAFNGEVTPVLDERTQPFLADGENGFDFQLLQQVLSRMVATSFQQMVAADKAHVDELANDVAPRTRRDEAVSAVRRKLIEIRGFAESLFGPDRAREVVAVEGETAYEPELLWRQAEHTLSRLEDPGLVLPPLSSAAVTFDPVGYAAELAPLVTTLRQVIGEIQLDAKPPAFLLPRRPEEPSPRPLRGRPARPFTPSRRERAPPPIPRSLTRPVVETAIT